MTFHWIATPQGNLYARSWEPGQGSVGKAPLVLFHDSLGCVALWRDFPAALANATGRKVVAYDRLGFGRSAPHPGRLSDLFIHDEARSYFPLLSRAFGMERFIAFGYSVGGGIAANCAALYPEACTALITMSAQAWVDEGMVRGLRRAQQDFSQPGQLERLARYHGDKAGWVLRAWLDTWLSESFRSWRIEQTAAGIRCPLLALHGDQDEYGSLAHPHHIASLTSGPSEVLILKDCHHTPLREHPDAVLNAIQGFCAKYA